ncbi:hypothetical protein QFC19_006796 [Naganishia cerealis]|uniref:Uncharacterized protein n=1 Tax=Naganishia cerealis TaxID=610337 RepID=A0ACC2VF08_9TREE|nr:hypothetical protein QFC19_006796 [Naganishia cerealis]
MRLYASGSAIRPATYLFDTSSRIGSTPGVNPTASRNHDDTSPDNATGRTGLTLPDELRDQLCEAIVNALDDTRVLPLLKALQQEFDPIGIEGLAQIAKDHHECEGGEILSQPQHQVTTNVFSDSLLGDPSSAELEAVQQFWLSAQSRRPISSEKPDEGEKETEAEPQLPLPTDLRTLLVRHGISAIFKDCSIIIRFPGALRNHQPGSDALAFELVNSPSAILKIIDLDLKPLKKANKWYELDDRIWRNALQPDFCGVHPLLQRLCVS